MQIDFQARELTVKLVYYGPALSGKTTNLQAIHKLVTPDTAGRLMTLETRDDRTLFFDLLPLTFSSGSGIQVRFKLFTVPGQVIHNATRRLVLQGADGTAFIADSQVAETRANQQAFLNMQENLRENGLDPTSHPLVIQFNKRDLPGIRTDEEIDRLAERGSEPVFKAVAIRGVGVIETFLGLTDLTWRALEEKHSLHEKFGLDPDEFLRDVRVRLGIEGRAAE
ncbi:MAG TPA: gliding motility protein [Polyangiaceae bacterium LLY-WYZ-15_(1-7)]|nr:gliding motility protein [Sandaracinus sp.]HJK89662.1 gliding motility protein [Polyangiaceae bacterium LLY-WYZ-15_(1-7)]HJL01112.1 gliding motility protein [Polyangiaceae bacterium LLY-WYZ-15_(1-7)]HJL09963.1 gliding motility protein [Polyangiaceae bacterium LLY-WYZ-15_(1-7)]HJL25443.1 gliding motility protein [Polyangiaceae bacterium LLY-WYZ-15_(1-7)]|tara:strand:- start:232 stop:903 length:672 start_codon:yes stop_codon:yes gene_type:complete